VQDFIAAAAKDRSDGPSGWIPNSPPHHPPQAKVSYLPNFHKPSPIVANISSRIPPTNPHRVGAMAEQQQQQQQAKKSTKQQDVIVSHIANVANHMVQSQKRLAGSSGNNDLNRRMLRENTAELLRNLATIQRMEQGGSNDKKIKSVSRMNKEPMAAAHADTRSGQKSNLMLLRAKRDEAAMTVRKEIAASMLETSAFGAQMELSRGKGYQGNGGKRKEARYRPSTDCNVREKALPSSRQRVSRHTHEDDEAEFDLHEVRADRLDRVKSMMEELRYLRSVKCGTDE
jgi:hypothetical protein